MSDIKENTLDNENDTCQRLTTSRPDLVPLDGCVQRVQGDRDAQLRRLLDHDGADSKRFVGAQ